MFCFATVLWGLWTTRNKSAIEGKFPLQLTEILYKINMWMQRWQVLLKGEECVIPKDMFSSMKAWMEDFMRRKKNQTTVEDFMLFA